MVELSDIYQLYVLQNLCTMTYEERCKYFWQQYNGEVLAIDLPQEYIEQDTRIFCVNEDCFVREKCKLFERYKGQCKTFGRTVVRGCIEDAKGRHKRPEWDKNTLRVHYMNASFGMNPEQKGIEPCKNFMHL